jgi:hypothetical protein
LVGGANFSEYIKKLKTGEFVKENKNQWSNPNYVMSDSTRQKIIDANTRRLWSDQSKEKHSVSMKKAVENHPESYTSSNRGRVKQIVYKGIKFQGNWELDFYKWCETNSISCIRNTEGFKYEWNGNRTYFPDFYLIEKDMYVEVKGYKTERDSAKWEQFPKQLIVVQEQDIMSIRKNIYTLPL